MNKTAVIIKDALYEMVNEAMKGLDYELDLVDISANNSVSMIFNLVKDDKDDLVLTEDESDTINSHLRKCKYIVNSRTRNRDGRLYLTISMYQLFKN